MLSLFNRNAIECFTLFNCFCRYKYPKVLSLISSVLYLFTVKSNTTGKSKIETVYH